MSDYKFATKTIELPKGLPVKRVKVRELCGRDRIEAGRIADAMAGMADGRMATNFILSGALTAQSICEIDGKEVSGGLELFEIFQEWPLRLQEIIIEQGELAQDGEGDEPDPKTTGAAKK